MGAWKYSGMEGEVRGLVMQKAGSALRVVYLISYVSL